jgi:hypothetical protein
MLKLEFFAKRSFSIPITANGLMAFGLFGALFVLTQFLQFELGFTPLEAGVRVLPAAGAIAVVAPLSSVVVRRFGARLTLAAGLLVVAVGLWQVSRAGVTTGYGGIVPGMVILGCGSGLVIPATTGSVMASLPEGSTGVGSATLGTLMQVGGALGVAVIGSLLSTRYQHKLGESLAPYKIPAHVHEAILGSLGGALQVAAHLTAPVRDLLVAAARAAFMSGADLGLLIGACVALAGSLLVLIALPRRHGG